MVLSNKSEPVLIALSLHSAAGMARSPGVAWHLIVRMRCQRFQQVSLIGNLSIGT